MLEFLENACISRKWSKFKNMLENNIRFSTNTGFFLLDRTAPHPQKVQIIMYVFMTTGLIILSVLHHSRHRHSFNDFFLETKVS